MLAGSLPDVMEWRKKVFHLFPCFVINSATFLSEEVCICSSGLALLRRRFPRTLSTVSLILQKQTGFVLLLFLQLILSIMTFVIWQIRKEKMSLSLMTAFSTVPAVRKRNWDQKFLTTRICISKRASGCLLLSWSDGNTLIPVNSCLLASAKNTNIIGPVKEFDNRTLAGKRRALAQTKAPEAMMTLLNTALSAGLKADYVLFDSWFSNPAQVTSMQKAWMWLPWLRKVAGSNIRTVVNSWISKKSIPGTKSAVADRGLFQNLQIHAESGWRMPQFILWCTDSPCGDRVYPIYVTCNGAAPKWRLENAWWTVLLPCWWNGRH